MRGLEWKESQVVTIEERHKPERRRKMEAVASSIGWNNRAGRRLLFLEESE